MGMLRGGLLVPRLVPAQPYHLRLERHLLFQWLQCRVFAEYYVYVRSMAKTTGIAGSEMLNDEYLYFKADPQTLHTTYADVAQSVAQLEQNLVPAPQAAWIHRISF